MAEIISPTHHTTTATAPPPPPPTDYHEAITRKASSREEDGEHPDLKAKKIDYSGAAEKTDPEEIALVKKLDRYIMPSLWAMYWLNYLDRNAIAHARLDTLEEDLGLVGSQYNTCVSILFVGYLIAQVPSNMFLTRTRPSIYMCICMMGWAIVSGCTALATDYKSLLTTRFLLGVAEAPYYPGALYLLSIFYTRKEIATRISILYTGNILATAFSGLIAAGVFHGLSGVHGIAGWRWLFIIEGVATFITAVIATFFLPDTPLTTRWLTPAERTLAHGRIEADIVQNQAAGGHVTSTLEGLKSACRDPKLWLFALMQNLHLSANGFKNFFPSVVKTLGFSTTITLLLTCPPYLIAGVFSVLTSISSGKYNERTWHITVSKAVAIIGFVLAAATLNIPTRYFAMCVFSIGTYCVNSIILGWVSSTLSETAEKKAVSLSIVNTFANASFVYTPYLFPSWDEPRYALAMGTSAGFSLGTAICAWAMRLWLQKINKGKRREREEEGSGMGEYLYYAY